jgi:hypothetical protein
MMVCILITGCIGTEEHNQTIPSSPSPNLTQPVPDETYWVHLDPVGNISSGDTFVITGTTNLRPGEDVLIEVFRADFDPKEKLQCGMRGEYGAAGTTRILNGSQTEVNTFMFPVESSTSVDGVAWKPREYAITVRSTDSVAHDRIQFTMVHSNLSETVDYTKYVCR